MNVPMKIQPKTFAIQDYLNQSFECECCKTHETALKHVVIEPNALEKVPQVMRSLGTKKAFVVSDVHTHQAAGEMLIKILQDAGIEVCNYTFPDEDLVPDEYALGRLLIALDPTCDLLIGVGTGSINDLCKFTAFKTGLSYCIVATAPSMDGFASSVAPLIVDHLKTTYEVGVADAIIGDTKILSKAPMPMILAGIADILGKYTCLTDWKMANLINGEYYCETIVEMVRLSLRAVVENIDRAVSRDEQTVGKIMEALVLTGIAMSFVGNSRPASGSEHHVSHYWEMMFLHEGKKAVLHGTKVGIGTVAVSQMYDWLWETPIDFEAARQKARNWDREEWEKNIRRAYPDAAEGVLALERETGKNAPEGVLQRIDAIEKNFEQMKTFARTWLPKSATIHALLADHGAPVNPHEVGISSQQIEDGVIYAKELRNRYGLLQILFDLGLIEPFAKRLTDFFDA